MSRFRCPECGKAFALEAERETHVPCQEGVTEPDFEGFAKSLEAEVDWSAIIHPDPNHPADAGQSLVDRKVLRELEATDETE